MKNIRNTSVIVQGILEQHPETRNSDNLLYIKVVESINSDLIYKPMQEVFLQAKAYGIPPFESVRRTRQKLQAEFPELRAKKEIEAEREINQYAVVVICKDEKEQESIYNRLKEEGFKLKVVAV